MSLVEKACGPVDATWLGADGEPPVIWDELDEPATFEVTMALDGLKK